jgi:hypothetical protein
MDDVDSEDQAVFAKKGGGGGGGGGGGKPPKDPPPEPPPEPEDPEGYILSASNQWMLYPDECFDGIDNDSDGLTDCDDSDPCILFCYNP